MMKSILFYLKKCFIWYFDTYNGQQLVFTFLAIFQKGCILKLLQNSNVNAATLHILLHDEIYATFLDGKSKIMASGHCPRYLHLILIIELNRDNNHKSLVQA